MNKKPNMTKKYTEEPISEYVLEFRYRANPKVLDYRGTWAELLSKYMNLENFAITENRVDVFNKDQSMRMFVSFMNSGLILRNNTNHQFFSDKCEKFLRLIFEEKGFGDPIYITRIGVRFRCGFPYKGDFEELMDKIIEKQISLSPAMLDIVKGKIVDVGSPVNFQTSIGNLNTMTGPMKENQLKEFFSNYIQQVGKQDNEANAKEVKFPSVSYYLDLDYWTRPDKEETSTELIKEIRNFSQAISEITDKIVKLVF